MALPGLAEAQCASPSKRPISGGTVVTLSGAYSRVLFGGVDATSVESYESGYGVDAYWYTTCVTPPHDAATVDVVANGAVLCPGGFTYAGAAPTASFAATPVDGEAPLTVQFTDTSTAGSTPVAEWNWSFGDHFTAYTQDPTHVYANPGTYYVWLTVTDGNNYSSKSSTVSIRVTGVTVPNVLGLMQAEAEAALVHAGLTATVTPQFNATIPEGVVISQGLRGGTLVPSGTLVSLVVSLGLAPPITSITDLQKIGNDPAWPLNGAYVLGQDIDASATATWNGGAGFIPIAYNGDYAAGNGFVGTFDGQNHVISNLIINDCKDKYVGLFGFVCDGGQVKNVGIKAGAVSGNAEGSEVGSLVGYSLFGTISNCYATGAVTGSGYFVGGLVGFNEGVITNSFATGAASGSGCVGGLVGDNYCSPITNCYATGAVTGSGYSGGLVGGNVGTITNSYATGAVAGSGYVGGLAGSNDYSSFITNCYATGAVSGAGLGVHAGGLVGVDETGLEHGAITFSYWDTDTSDQSTAGWTFTYPNDTYSQGISGPTGESDVAMKARATFVGWDFTKVWGIVEGQTYPFLYGGVMVTILPAAAITAGAQWSIDGGATWIASGLTVANLLSPPDNPVTLAVTFKPVSGWTAPGDQTMTISAGHTASVTGTYTPPPEILSIACTDANPSNTSSVSFLVTFNEPVTGVDASDFVLTTSGVTRVSISDVSANTGASRTVTVATGTGDGTIRLDVLDDDSVVNVYGVPLGGAGIGNGNFSAGETYTIQRCGTIATNLSNAKAYVGESLTFWVHAICGGAPSYQWVWSDGEQDVLPVGSNTDTLKIGPVKAEDAGFYWCYVTADGVVYPTDVTVLSVADHLKMVEPPRAGNAAIGSTFTFDVLTSGGFAPLAYLWKHDGKPVGTDSTLAVDIRTLQDGGIGSYSVQISDSNSDVLESEPVVLTTDVGLPYAGVAGAFLIAAACALAGIVVIRSLKERA